MNAVDAAEFSVHVFFFSRSESQDSKNVNDAVVTGDQCCR
jgi:hypothetical protein